MALALAGCASTPQASSGAESEPVEVLIEAEVATVEERVTSALRAHRFLENEGGWIRREQHSGSFDAQLPGPDGTQYYRLECRFPDRGRSLTLGVTEQHPDAAVPEGSVPAVAPSAGGVVSRVSVSAEAEGEATRLQVRAEFWRQRGQVVHRCAASADFARDLAAILARAAREQDAD